MIPREDQGELSASLFTKLIGERITAFNIEVLDSFALVVLRNHREADRFARHFGYRIDNRETRYDATKTIFG